MGVGVRPGSPSPAPDIVENVVVVVSGFDTVIPGPRDFCRFGCPRLGIGVMISLVSVGGSRALSLGLQAAREGTGVEVTSLDICDNGTEAVTDIVGSVGAAPSPPPIIGESVGGPIALDVAGFRGMLEIGGLGDPTWMCGEPGDPGCGRFTAPPAIRGIIFMPDTPFGAGGRPTPF